MNKFLLSFSLLLALCTSCQKEIKEELPEFYLQADSTSLLLPGIAGGKDSFQIKSNIEWQITIVPATADWLTTNVIEGEGSLEVSVLVQKNNTSDTVQKAQIVISPVNNPAIKPITISVSQNKPVVKARNAYGGTELEQFIDAIATADGGVIAVGSTNSKNGDVSGNKGEDDAWIIKVDDKGNKVWQKTLGSSGYDLARCITKSNDGNFLVAIAGDADLDFAGMGFGKIVKIDGNGNVLWKKSVNMEIFAIMAAQGGYVLAGNSDDRDFSILKTDEDFNVLWQKKYGGSLNDNVFGMVAASDNGYVITGNTFSNDRDITINKGSVDVWVIKVDQNGNLVWQKSYGGSSHDYSSSIVQAPDGGYVVVGATESTNGDVSGHHGNPSGPSNDNTDGWVLKLDANGNKVWAKAIGGTLGDLFDRIIPAQGGGFLLTGSSRSKDYDVPDLNGVSDAWVVKLNDNGGIVWSKTPGGSDEESAGCILEPSKGNYIIVGSTFSNDEDVVGLNGYGDGWIYRFK